MELQSTKQKKKEGSQLKKKTKLMLQLNGVLLCVCAVFYLPTLLVSLSDVTALTISGISDQVSEPSQ